MKKYFPIICTNPMFLDGDIGEMDKHVVQFITAGIILDSAESTESKTVPTAYNRKYNMHINHIPSIYRERQYYS